MTDLRVNLAGVELKNPIVVPSGTFGFGREYGQFFDLSELGAICVKGLTPLRREGNPAPRIAETPMGILNSVGLQNPGVDAFIAHELPYLRQFDVKVIANISEQYFSNVKVGMPVKLTVDIFPDEEFTGTVSLIYPALDPTTRTFKVEVKVPNAKRTLRPGMYARTTFDMGSKEGVMVPDVAVQKQVGSAERYLYVIEGDSVAERRSIKVGRQVGDRVDILSGVEPGEQVAVTALSKLFDGAAVDVKKD